MTLRSAALLPLLFLSGCDHTPLRVVEDPPVECFDGTFPLTRRTPAVMFVLDRSGSMNQAFGAGTRWTTLTQSLGTTLKALGDDVEVGAYLYPDVSADAEQCSVPSTPALTPAAGQGATLTGLLTRTTPGGATPTADALLAAGDALDRSVSGNQGRTLVLATDGAPNCNAALSVAICTCADAKTCGSALRCLDDTRTVSRVAALAARGVPTWVIGVATDATANGVLDALARAGGRPRAGARAYASASSPQELVQAFGDIQRELSACTFRSTSAPDSTGTALLRLGDAVVPYDPTGVEGWTWSWQDRGELVLRGAACTRAAASPALTVTLTVQCGDTLDAGEPLD